MPRLAGAILTAVALVPWLACIDSQPYRCSDDDDCVSVAGPGVCEASFYCSYDDEECDSGRRYSDLAGPFAEQCTEPEAGTGPGTSGGVTSDGTGDSGETSEATTATTGDDASTGETGDVPSGMPRWEHVFMGSGGGNDTFKGVLLLEDGDLLVVGNETGLTSDAAFVRFTPDGDVVEHALYDVGQAFDQVLSLVDRGGGEVWVCGRGDPAAQQPRAWVAAIDPNDLSAPLIEATLDHDTCMAIGVLDDATLVAAGQNYKAGTWTYEFSPTSPDTGTTTSQTLGSTDTWAVARSREPGELFLGGFVGGTGAVRRYADGALGPDLFTSDGPGRVQGLALEAERMVAGGYESEGSLATPWVTARAYDGAEHWTWRPDTTDPMGAEIEAVAIDAAGNSILVGFGGAPSRQRWIVKLDPSGLERWSVRLPLHTEGGYDIARDVVVLPDQDLVVVGELRNADGTFDAWIGRLAP